MAYTLATAISELKRSQLWNERAVVREPLEGLFDASNKVFYTAQKPIASTGITVYDNNGDEYSSGSYTVDSHEFGTVRFTGTAPSTLHYISYTAQMFTDDQLTDIAKNGFDKMEQSYPRGWFLTSGSIISSSSSTVVDPVVGSTTFSASRLHVKLYLLCCEWELAFAMRKYAAMNYFSYRESRSAGVSVDRTRNADHLKAIMSDLQDQIDDIVDKVASQADDYPWGSWVPGSKSDSYLDTWDWYTDSRQDRGEVA
jgi:hypothetical protein